MKKFNVSHPVRVDRHPALITADKLATNPVPIAELIKAHLLAGKATETELAAQLGFYNDAVVRLIVAGTMKVPLNLLPGLANALAIDEIALAGQWMRDYDPRLQDYFFERMRELANLTPSEVDLINRLRELNPGRGVSPVVFDKGSIIALLEC